MNNCFCVILLHLGPAVGAALYEVGGFSLPFLICGSLGTILATLLFLTTPTLNTHDAPIETNIEKDQDDDDINDSMTSLTSMTSMRMSMRKTHASMEVGTNEDNEKTTLLKACDTPKETTGTSDDSMDNSVLG